MPVPAHLPALARAPLAPARRPGHGWRRWLAGGFLALAAGALPAAELPAGAATALTGDGQVLSGAASLSGGALTIGSGATSIDRLIECRFAVPRLHWLDQGVILPDGQVLRGAVREFQNGTLSFASDLFGEESLPAEGLAAIVLSPVSAGRPLAAASGGAGIVLANGEHIAGTVTFVDQNAVGLSSGKRVRTIPRDRVRLVVLRAATPAEGTWVELCSGDALVVSLTALDATSASLSTSFGSLRVPGSQLSALWCESRALQPLDRLSAIAASAPSFDESFTARQGEEPLCPASPTGTALPAASPLEDVRRGIVIPIGTTLTWSALTGATSLVAEVAPGAGQEPVTAAVLLDGKEVFSSGPMAPGSPPRPVSVALGGATTLALQVRHGETGALGGGSAVWGCPTLVK